MDHLTDRQLELWVKSKDLLDHEVAAAIPEHVSSCQLCKERLQSIKAYYNDLDQELSREPGQRERSIASKIYQHHSKALLPSGSLIQTYEAPLQEYHRSLPVQFMNYLRRHPVAAASTTIGSIFAAALLLIVQPWASKDLNPAYAEVERNVLHVYNLQGETIWNLPVNNIPNGITSEGIHGDYNKHFLRIADLDGDGKNELLLTGNNQTGTFTTDSLYVFNNNGTLRWSQAPPPPVLFGDRTHTLASNWNITDFFTLDQPGEATRLFVTANSNWFPSVLFELDVSSGEILQSYWNAGWIRTREVYPYGEGGRQLILLGVVNNSYQHAALIVLDPDRINGHSPLHESYKPAGIGPADELHYILFKPSHLNRLYSNHLYNYGAGIRLSRDGSLQVAAHENLHKLDRQVSILYTLDQHFTVLEAYGSASYQRLYSELYEEGELAEPMNEQYWESLKNSVLYWDGEQFVSK